MKIKQQRNRCFIVQAENMIDNLFINSNNIILCSVLLKCMKFSELYAVFNISSNKHLVEEYDTCYHILESIWENIR